MKKSINRRHFLFKCGVSGVAVVGVQALGSRAVMAADMEAVDPTSAQAMALGYVTDATTTDTAKFERYAAGQECVNCQLYQGAADSTVGACLLFVGKTVEAKGWCNSWVQKVG